jgi:hypothetical protein
MRRGPAPRLIIFTHVIDAMIHLCARSEPISTGTSVARALRDSPGEARCARSSLGAAARNQAEVRPRPRHPLDPGHPAPFPHGDVDMVGPGEGESAYALALRARVPGVVA